MAFNGAGEVDVILLGVAPEDGLINSNREQNVFFRGSFSIFEAEASVGTGLRQF